LAPQDDDFAFVLAASRRLLRQISQEITSATPAGQRGEVLAGHALGALAAIQERVDAIDLRYPELNGEKAKKAASRALRFYSQLVWSTHHALQWLRGDESELLDLGALCLADELVLALLGPGVEVTPVESTDYMYSTSSWPLDWLLKEQLGEPIPESARPIPIVLAFPARERYTTLLHCLFAHELSHTAVRVHQLVDQALEPLKTKGEYENALNAACTGVSLPPEVVAEYASARAEVWLEELCCDALAFALLGPAYLFAFAELGLSVGWSEPDDEHPSMAVRTRLLVEFAERTGWASFLSERLPTIWAWFAYAAEAPSVVKGAVETFAEQMCSHSFESIFRLAEACLGDRRFTLDKWKTHETNLAELLDNDILPIDCSDGSPASHPELLTACWLQVLRRHGDKPEAISEAVAEADYQRFVAKALEMSTTVRVWGEVRAQ
jgi:hypothetical protein